MTLTEYPPQLSTKAKPFWQQSTTIFTGILGLLVAYPILQDSKTPHSQSLLRL